VVRLVVLVTGGSLIQVVKGRGNPIKYLAQGHNKRTCQPLFMLHTIPFLC